MRERIARAAERGGIHVIVNYETTWYRSHAAHLDASSRSERRRGGIRKMVAMDGHQGPKEIGVQPEFFAWLTDPVQERRRRALRLRLLRREPDDVADGRTRGRSP